MTGRKPLTDADAFELFNERYIVEPNTGCWLWTADTLKNGYGRLKWKQKEWKAHRASWLFHYGDPGKLYVCHKCDTPACVNPDHLFLGTAGDNRRDCSRKQRTANQKKTHCPKGHAFSGNNLIYQSKYNRRVCKRCHQDNFNAWRRRKRKAIRESKWQTVSRIN